MHIALVQFNATVGDLRGNADRMIALALTAADADLIVFPELAISGYPPKDLVLQQGFVDDCERAADRVAAALAHSPCTLVIGVPLRAPGSPASAGGVSNALLAYRAGERIARYDKRLLPTYDVFDENRYFTPGTRSVVIDVPARAGNAPARTWRVGLSICEDLWRGEDAGFSHRYFDAPDPVAALVQPQPDGRPGAEIIINPSASPFVLGKGARHRAILRGHAQRHGVHVAAVNVVGGNDELVFDGHAAVFDPRGRLLAAGPGFAECVVPVRIDPALAETAAADPLLSTADERLLFDALVLGVRDYLRKTGFKSALLGLSGGIDSAVTAVIGVAALGAANIRGVSLPSRYSSDGSKTDAHDLAQRLSIRLDTLSVEPAFVALLDTLTPVFAGRSPDVTEENLQSRVRGTLLMALSNKTGALLLTTGNKSELAVGYCTLYGDMNGGLAVLSDVTKQWVYRLARWMNAHPDQLGIPGLTAPPIPEPSITKPPSAELRENQTDQDSLPPYDVLDEIIERYVERRQASETIVRESGFDGALVARVLRLIDLSEYKRKQAAIGLKVTGVAFGSGRRMPIAARLSRVGP